MRFAVVGGDRRSALLAEQLARDGHKVYTYALEKAELPEEAVKSGCLQGCVYGADCIVLPVPAERSGYICTPLGMEPLESEWFLSALWPGQLVCGGKLSGSFCAAALDNGIIAEDVLARPAFAYGNAALTAEGAVGILLGESEKSLRGSRVLVLGCGRLGKLLALRLKGLGAAVTVAARRGDARAEAEELGMSAVELRKLELLPGGFDFIVNTIPARVLTEKQLCSLEDTVLLELASAPGGFDPRLAENLGLRVIAAPGLPGKCAPYAAAELMKQTVYDIIREQGDRK